MTVQVWKDVVVVTAAVITMVIVSYSLLSERLIRRNTALELLQSRPPYYMAWSDIGKLDEDLYPAQGYYFVLSSWVYGPYASEELAREALAQISLKRTGRL